ncbi:tRNA pseudouridine synthase-like 1 isoform X6 [Pezoporus flaviventris]|uniref:tRNA pseudouridine synthase-like 1 isoform X6 n=1 Tax=Pezoporus flaviventris TaxID=889875 RepID=UPI002AB13874|nr:tRNA pseudouridine synthase-like 1 isoform X6 [Pezoporus flaviventris]
MKAWGCFCLRAYAQAPGLQITTLFRAENHQFHYKRLWRPLCELKAGWIFLFKADPSGVMETSSDQSLIGVQNYLEKAVQNLKPVAPVKFHISSRTDTGVHALCNSAHLDIQRAPGKPAFEEKQLVHGLNRHLKPEPIRILNAHRVPSTFHARFSALSRTYIYRLLMGCSHHSEIPVFERDLCWAPGGGGLEFWELKFRSRSFLYRQVRRMVGALVAVGQGKLTPHRIKELLELKDSRAFPPNAMAPPSGLFLKSVEYSEADLDTTAAPGE